MRRTVLMSVTTVTTLILTATVAVAATVRPDQTFSGDGAVVVDALGREFGGDVVPVGSSTYLVGGTFKGPDAPCRFLVARVDAQGRLDGSYGRGGVKALAVGERGCATSATLAADGGLLVAGWAVRRASTFAVVAKLKGNGALDRSFGKDGIAWVSERFGAQWPQVEVTPSGSIWLTWSGVRNWDTGEGDYRVSRLRASGSLIRDFGRDGVRTVDVRTIDWPYDIAVDDAGALYATGETARRKRADGAAAVFKATASGVTVRTLNVYGDHGTIPVSIDIDAFGRPVLGLAPADQPGWGAVRLDDNLRLDTTYGVAGIAKHRCDCWTLNGALTDTGLVLIGSTRTTRSATLVAGFTPDGQWDADIADRGRMNFFRGWEYFDGNAVVDGFGRILLAGTVQGEGRNAAIARLTIS